MIEETLIGNGIYLSVAAGMIKIRTKRGKKHEIIYLEQDDFIKLDQFAKAVWPAPVQALMTQEGGR